jgi:hypothetical protein
VDGDAEHAPDSVGIQDLANTAQQAAPVAPAPIAKPAKPQGAVAQKAEPVAPAPIAQPAEPQEAVVAAMEDGSNRNVEAAKTVQNDVKSTSTQLESHRVLNPDAHTFVIEDGSEAATQVGHKAANKVGKRTACDDGNKAADDDWIEVQSKQHRRSKRTPLTLSAKGTSILRGHPKGGLSSNGNFPRLKIANHAHVWLNKNKPSDNEGFIPPRSRAFYTTPRTKSNPRKARRHERFGSKTPSRILTRSGLGKAG